MECYIFLLSQSSTGYQIHSFMRKRLSSLLHQVRSSSVVVWNSFIAHFREQTPPLDSLHLEELDYEISSPKDAGRLHMRCHMSPRVVHVELIGVMCWFRHLSPLVLERPNTTARLVSTPFAGHADVFTKTYSPGRFLYLFLKTQVNLYQITLILRRDLKDIFRRFYIFRWLVPIDCNWYFAILNSHHVKPITRYMYSSFDNEQNINFLLSSQFPNSPIPNATVPSHYVISININVRLISRKYTITLSWIQLLKARLKKTKSVLVSWTLSSAKITIHHGQ